MCFRSRCVASCETACGTPSDQTTNPSFHLADRTLCPSASLDILFWGMYNITFVYFSCYQLPGVILVCWHFKKNIASCSSCRPMDKKGWEVGCVTGYTMFLLVKPQVRLHSTHRCRQYAHILLDFNDVPWIRPLLFVCVTQNVKRLRV